MRKFSITTLLVVGFICLWAFTYIPIANAKVKWTPTDVITKQWNTNKKPILVDIYTDWCHYCKVMDNTTYSNDSIANYLNLHFYTAKVNAESKSNYNWMGRVYSYIPKFKVNQLAIDLTDGNMVYPTTVIIPPDGAARIMGGALSVNELEMILKYYGDEYYKTTEWSAFIKTFKCKW